MDEVTNPRPPPKNGMFYTISELKELGEDVSNHFGEPKSKKKRESKKKEIEELESEEEKIPEEKEKKKTKKTEKKPETPKKTKRKTTSTTGNKAKVSKDDKVSWITQKGRRIMIYNGVKKQGAVAHTIWEEYQKLNPSPSKRKKEEEEEEEILPKKKSRKKESTGNIVETNQELLKKYIQKNPSNTIFKNVNKSKKPTEDTIEITDSD
jgi:hypothetical protein